MNWRNRMRAAALLIGMTLSAVILIADDHTVDFDRHTDFSLVKTFAVREGKVDSPSPELDNTLLLKKIADTIRMDLTSKGLKETLNNPDVVVDYSISGQEFNEQRGGPVSSSEGTLVIDLTKRDSRALIWRGVYRDSERNSGKLAQKLPGDARKTMAEFPPRQKGVIEPGPSTLVDASRPGPKAAAAAALDIVRSTTLDTDFVGGDVHPGLAISLGMLERAARAVAEDNGRSPSVATKKAIAFYEALSSALDTATSISGRGVESENSRSKAMALAKKLSAVSEP